jgi:hypothetical protein
MRSINLKKAVTWALVGSLAAFGSAAGGPCSIGSGAAGGGKQPVSAASDAAGGNAPLSQASGGGRGMQAASDELSRGSGRRPVSETPGGGAGKQPNPDESKGSGGNKPLFEVSNSLAYPSVLVGGGAEAYYDIQFDQAVLGADFSYGCPDTTEGAEYPNLSCSNDLGTIFYQKTSPECRELCGASAERMFFQKVSGNVWSADTVAPAPGFNDRASHVDWGDALESRTSAATSVVRVETMPFYTNPGESECYHTGYEMWHAYGLGRTEMWGLRVSDAGIPYSFEQPYAIIRTTNAKLLISKLGAEEEACPTIGVEGGSSPYKTSINVWTGQGWQGAAFNHEPIAYTPELSISGKYVYGYNWMLQNFEVPANLHKAGWWRLTFYTDNGEVVFLSDTKIGAPWDEAEAEAVAVVQVEVESETGESSYPIYSPVVSPQAGGHNLTYIDICLSAEKGGGDKGRKSE